MQLLGHGNPFHETLYALLCYSEGHKVWRSLAIDSADSWRFPRTAHQHALTALCQFT
ncbi:unnamed protein product [Staurois parvus]|uniref:Uncharacterized protein n=1 Tax=Staurois parvus TaxID=386267 RepID=A0ABN9F3P7_9NEOB|nr:unnamed protein product [Staurois parvus]